MLAELFASRPQRCGGNNRLRTTSFGDRFKSTDAFSCSQYRAAIEVALQECFMAQPERTLSREHGKRSLAAASTTTSLIELEPMSIAANFKRGPLY